jgi:hypothetical protein
MLLALVGPPAIAQTPAPAQPPNGAKTSEAELAPVSAAELVRRLQRLEEQNTKLAEQNARITRENQSLTQQFVGLKSQYNQINRRLEQMSPASGIPMPAIPPLSPSAMSPLVNDDETLQGDDQQLQGSNFPSGSTPGGTPSFTTPRPGSQPPSDRESPERLRFLVGDYDDNLGQFVLVRPWDAEQTPFELRADLFTQARYTGFARSAERWTDSTGAPQPINNYSSVEITRNFIQFSGFALDPKLQFTAFLFSSTALNDTVYLGWINYRFSDAFDLRIGNWIVPGTREWNESFRYTLGADRSMATTFFRPNISPGIWAQGEPIKNVNYVAMYANSLNRFSQGVERIGSAGAFGGTVWWEPMGSFGPGPSDNEDHQQLTPRIGTNLALSREQNQGFTTVTTAGPANPEDTILRLSDGTPLFRSGALGPNVTLMSAAVQIWTIDAAIKYRGLGLSGEYFMRWIDAFDSRGGRLPTHSLFDYGALLQCGYYVVPKNLETYARSSFVNGQFGGGYEVGAGVNWYVKGSREWRITFEVLEISHSPAQNILTGYRAGESGTLFQLQWFSDF